MSFTLLGGSTRELISCTLTVDDGGGGVDSDTVTIDIIDPAHPGPFVPSAGSLVLDQQQVDVNIAIAESSRFLYLSQASNGSWPNGGAVDTCATTGASVWALSNSGHQPTDDINTDIYAEHVQRGVDFILAQNSLPTFGAQPNIGNPDSDGNGRIISLCGNNAHAIGYANPIVTAAIVAAYSGTAGATLVPSGAFAGESYFDVVEDAIDFIAWSQQDAGVSRGGWRYTFNVGSDVSADSWNYVAMEGFEQAFGGAVLAGVKAEAEIRIDATQCQLLPNLGMFPYASSGAGSRCSTPANFGSGTTGGGLSGLVLLSSGGYTAPCLNGGACSSAVFPDVTTRKAKAVEHIARIWNFNAGLNPSTGCWNGHRSNPYAMWVNTRALRLNGTTTLTNTGTGTTFDWETGENQATPGTIAPPGAPDEGYWPLLVRQQATDGAWRKNSCSPYNDNFETAFDLLILQPSVFGPPNQPPVAVCQDVTEECVANQTANISVDGGSFDPDGDPITLTQTPAPPYAIFPPGMFNVDLTVTDPSGASDMCTAKVTIVDTIKPVITLNGDADMTLECGVDTFTDPGATAADSCDQNVPVVVGGDTVDPSTPGVYVLTYDATDDSGNAADQVTRTVTVGDNMPPDVSASTGIDTLWPPNHKLVDVEFDFSVSDACDDSATVAISVTSDESAEDTADGHHSPDARFIKDGSGNVTGLRLRSERRGDEDGRVYLIQVTATDADGNKASACSAVTVTHSQSAADLASVAAQATAAVASCTPLAHNVLGPPPDGPALEIGPKQ
jgi:hypothetical protein